MEERETRYHNMARVDEYNRSGYDYRGAFMDDPTRLRRPDRAVPLQRVAVGNITTTRAVDMVEIGIKSTVWRQVNGFPNVHELDLIVLTNMPVTEQLTLLALSTFTLPALVSFVS